MKLYNIKSLKEGLEWQGQPISDLDDQYLCNIHWFLWVLHKEVHPTINVEIMNRFGSFENILPWKPLPITGEIKWLTDNGYIQGTDIVLKDGRVIGSIVHINEQKNETEGD